MEHELFTDLPPAVAIALLAGRDRLKAKQDAEAADEAAKRKAADDHWQALELAITHDLEWSGIGDLFVTLGDRPDSFRAPGDGWGRESKDHFLRLDVPGVGEIARHYSFYSFRDNPPDRWQPWHEGKDKTWAAITYETLENYDAGTAAVATCREKDWHWHADLGDALADAEIQYAARNKMLLDAEARLKASKEYRERLDARKTATKSTGEKLLDLLDDYIKECAPRTEE